MRKYPTRTCRYCEKIITDKTRRLYCNLKCRIMNNIPTSEINECWDYGGSLDACGYGRFRHGGREYKVHRFIWEMEHGKIPKGLFVLHHCDNPQCCNLNHLYVGTPKDNVRDMIMRNRRKPDIGSLNNFAKLDEPKVLTIKKRLSTGESLTNVARDYGVGLGTIFDIKHKKTWLHV